MSTTLALDSTTSEAKIQTHQTAIHTFEINTETTESSQFSTDPYQYHENKTKLDSLAFTEESTTGLYPGSSYIESTIQQMTEKHVKTLTHQNTDSGPDTLDNYAVDDNASVKLNYSEKIDHLPGKNRSMTVAEIFNHVVSNVDKATTKSEGIVSTPTVARYCNDEDDFSDVGEHLGDLLLLKDRLTNFSNVLSHVVSHGKTSDKGCIPVKNPISGLNGTDSTNETRRNISDSFPATDVKFLVSGRNSEQVSICNRQFFM